jgi:hypothetical protein
VVGLPTDGSVSVAGLPTEQTGTGCSNFESIRLDLLEGLNLVDDCNKECRDRVGCTGFGFQPFDCGGDQAVGKGGCYLWLGDCTIEINHCWNNYVVPEVERKPTPWVLVNSKTGCSNWEDANIADATTEPNAVACGLKCDGRSDCVGWNFQPRDCWEQEKAAWKGACYLWRSHCEQERVGCWDLYQQVGRESIVRAESGDRSLLLLPQVGRPMLTPEPADTSMLCLSLVTPWTDEKKLIAGQFEGGRGIFDCDEYAVYSSEELDLAPGLRSRKIDSDLVCEKGGELGTWLNTDIFLALWAKVLDEGRFTMHAWTAKVDADAVFLPNRLRRLLMRHSEDPQGVYLNNCKLGMQGPLEVFSRNALQALSRGKELCLQHFARLCSGPCKWGEDTFLDQCLSKVLNVTRGFERALLQEERCDPPPGWQACTAPGIAAFHPFKTVQGYRDCLDSANAVDAA